MLANRGRRDFIADKNNKRFQQIPYLASWFFAAANFSSKPRENQEDQDCRDELENHEFGDGALNQGDITGKTQEWLAGADQLRDFPPSAQKLGELEMR